ncbi:MAG: hypothetical protein JWL81_3495 [Verrucomicrobiales bacterium]|nr:hypothetical protein [Verrucomicrobiales bacterium]
MKLLNLTIPAFFCFSFLQMQAYGAVVLDSFSVGEFALKFDGPTAQVDVISEGFLDDRLARGAGVKDWSATLNITTNQLLYSVNLRGVPDGANWFGLAYRSVSGPFSLLGFDSVSLKIDNVVGTGDLLVFVGETPGASLLIPITGSGVLNYPISNIVTGYPLDAVPQLQFRFIAKTADFSISLDEITLVPEPSTVALAGIAAAGLLRRRRRA